MLYKQFAELKPDYQTITISVSEIERALNPTPSFMKQDDPRKVACTFWIGTIAEQIAWATVSQWEEAWLKQCQVARSYMDKDRMRFFSSSGVEDKQYEWFYDWMEQIVTLYKPWKWDYDLRSYRALCEIDFSWYKVLLTGELDRGINWVMLFDNKTARQKWKTEERRATWCYQARFYSWMNMLANPWVKDLSFVYLITTKQKKMQLQEFTNTISFDEAEWFVREALYNYLLWLHSWALEYKSSALDRL